MPDISEIYGGFDLSEKAGYLDEKNKCCGTAMKVWLIICNVILLILGVAALGVGIWVQGQPGFAWTAGSVGVGLIILGVFLMLIAIMGMVAAWKELRCLMAFYALLLFIFFIAELAALVVSAAATNVAVKLVNEGWKQMSEGQKDGVGIYFGCCGVAGAGAEKYSQDGTKSTCTDGESDPGDESTWTAGTGVCTIFGLDHAVDGKVTQVSFPKYKAEFLATEEGKACANTKRSENDKNTVIPPECLCPLPEGEMIPEKTCRLKMGEIPSCTSTEQAPFPFVAGLKDELVNVQDNIVSAPMAACYSKFETWLVENMMTCVIITAFVFVYQLIQLIFSFMLCCGFCGAGKKSDDEADLGPSGI